MNKLVGLIGAGGFAREVIPALAQQLAASAALQGAKIVFVESAPAATSVNGIKVMALDRFLSAQADEILFNIAIADSHVRQRIAEECCAGGASPFSIVSPHAVIYPHNDIGDGAIICANTMVTANARIGRFFHANIYSYVAHDCVIGDYVTFAPAVRCNGNVHIGDHAYIGTGAIIKQGRRGSPLKIGEGAVVGMGAVVTKDVPPHTTVVGNPAKPFQKTNYSNAPQPRAGK